MFHARIHQNPLVSHVETTLQQWHVKMKHEALYCNDRSIRASSDYAQVERRSVTFLDQTMSRGEAFGLEKYNKIIQSHILNILI